MAEHLPSMHHSLGQSPVPPKPKQLQNQNKPPGTPELLKTLNLGHVKQAELPLALENFASALFTLTHHVGDVSWWWLFFSDTGHLGGGGPPLVLSWARPFSEQLL